MKLDEVSVVLQGMKILNLVKKSTITRMASKPLETGKGVMWSTEIRSNGDWAGGRGCRTPRGLCRLILNRWHSGQRLTYCSTSAALPSQEYPSRFQRVCAIPGCPERM